ncbi:unnamed protein product [Cuscuta epithymum]|uniref:Uncharacterized protein n=1 Tax=Cuscuta epithymum TaxID=186058 RepID=A0AAV0GBT1_9ASTE|nr:unnamed protein product [Cuscuta epithymum]
MSAYELNVRQSSGKISPPQIYPSSGRREVEDAEEEEEEEEERKKKKKKRKKKEEDERIERTRAFRCGCRGAASSLLSRRHAAVSPYFHCNATTAQHIGYFVRC